MTDQTIIAYYQGIEVMVLPEHSFLNKNGTPIAAIEKIDDRVPDGIPVPKEVPFDNLAFVNGQKCSAKRLLKNLLIRQKNSKHRNNKTIKKPAVTH